MSLRSDCVLNLCDIKISTLLKMVDKLHAGICTYDEISLKCIFFGRTRDKCKCARQNGKLVKFDETCNRGARKGN